ncbi:hypothetical protein A3D79_02005 [Candidatus Daviesbacteria bacterium RIFCSPHIGHO2_02_FULL_39_8]|nr:MAG: hypothetical protein A3D79_02005 [Candidatus Daviesbacteria bacterium RIFCSPHIGHO2_02_FULL_39_8]
MNSILKQSSFLITAQIFGRVIGFFYTIFLARNLGVSDFGLLTTALVYFSLISVISDFGFNRYLIREIAIDHTKAGDLVWNISIFRLVITSVIFALMSIILYILDPDKLRVGMILLSISAIFPLSIAQTIDGIFIAKRKLQFSALALIFLSVSTALFGIGLVKSGFGVTGAVNALIWGHLVYLMILILFIWREKTKVISHVSLHTFKKIASQSLPYGLLGIIGLLYFKVDTLLLSYLRGNFETGIYGVAYRFLEAVVFIPSSISISIFPFLVKMHTLGSLEIRKVFKKTILIMGILGSVLTIAYILILPPVIELVLPEFSPSIKAIKILSFSIPFIFIYVPLSQIILSTDKYLKSLVILTIATLIFNIVLNFILIPPYGFLGASVATVASDILSLIVVILFIRLKIFKERLTGL